MPATKQTSHEGRSLAELESSLESFQQRVEANYRVFFNSTPHLVNDKRALFHIWLRDVAEYLKAEEERAQEPLTVPTQHDHAKRSRVSRH